ncbi:MAG: HAAS signaling domain-containing protein, partial [Brevibacterium aurantiacum]
MSALTTIYVDNVVSHLPEDSRGDIAAEIKATIDDMVEDRLGDLEHPADEQTAAAEREVLEELGDPAQLSREYTNSSQHLIGPKSYPVFIWAIRWVLPLVAVAAAVTNSIAFIATNDEVQIGALIGQLVGNTIVALLTAFAAITIIFALGDKEMSGVAADKIAGTKKDWSVDQLRATDAKAKQIRAEAVLNLIFLVLLAL